MRRSISRKLYRMWFVFFKFYIFPRKAFYNTEYDHETLKITEMIDYINIFFWFPSTPLLLPVQIF